MQNYEKYQTYKMDCRERYGLLEVKAFSFEDSWQFEDKKHQLNTLYVDENV